jgi:hypothetical protein
MAPRRNSSDAIEVSRKCAVAVGFMAVMPALGALLFGIAQARGDYLVVAALAASVTLMGYLWWSFALVDEHTEGYKLLALIAFVLMAGLALYLNAIYLLWGAGFELPIRASRDGTMGEHRFAGPSVLLYAVFAWVLLKVGKCRW